MSFTSLPKQWINAAFVFVQQRLVSQHAEQSQQNREAIYRDAHRIKQQLADSETQQAQRQIEVERLRAENEQLRQQAQANPFHDPDKVARYAAMAQAEGVSLPVAHRLLKILQARRPLLLPRSAAPLKRLNAKRPRS